MKFLLRISILICCCGLTTAYAQTKDMFGVWGSFTLKGDYSKLSHSLEGFHWQIMNQARTRDDSASGSHLSENLLFVQSGYQLNKHIALEIGYVHDWIHPLHKQAFQESRVYEDLVWKQNLGDFKFLSRTRMDQRINQTTGNTGYRARQFFKLSHAIPQVKNLSAYLGDEVLFYMDKNHFGKRGFSENRVLAGLHYQVQPAFTINLGYLGQYVDTKSSHNIFTHNLTAGVTYRF